MHVQHHIHQEETPRSSAANCAREPRGLSPSSEPLYQLLPLAGTGNVGRLEAVSGQTPAPILQWLGRVEYEPTWRAMQAFTETRAHDTPDMIWFLEHSPVFTLGMNGKTEHLLNTGDIPVIPIDRGGQVTYHGPGQLVIYPLLDLKRLKLGVRDLVTALESSVIATVKEWGIEAQARRDAPGVYVEGRKLASVGLRIRRGCSYHGMAFNIDMDTEPFARINPCGYAGLQVTHLAALGGPSDLRSVAQKLAPWFLHAIGIESRPNGLPEIR